VFLSSRPSTGVIYGGSLRVSTSGIIELSRDWNGLDGMHLGGGRC
jgi:hypothetical protein